MQRWLRQNEIRAVLSPTIETMIVTNIRTANRRPDIGRWSAGRSLPGVFALLLLPLIAEPSFALNPEHKLTQYVHRIWQTQPGLPQTSISAVTQTRDGYIWLGTESGVVRFDGVRFTPIPELERASLGDIWARTFVE